MFNQRKYSMKKIAVIYSPANLDSCLAASLVMQMHHFNAGTDTADQEVVGYPYNRAYEVNKLPEGADSIMLIGADLSPADMNELLNNSPSADIRIEAYLHAVVYNDKINERLNDRGAVYYRFSHAVAEKETDIEPSLTKKIIREASEAFLNTVNKDLLVYISEKLYDYCTFKSLPMDDALMMFANVEIIRYSCVDTKPFKLDFVDFRSPSEDVTFTRLLAFEYTLKEANDTLREQWLGKFQHLVADIKSLTNNCMQSGYYAGANGSSFITPTINVTERDNMAVVRFIKLGNSEVISYEDQKHVRVYRIVCSPVNLPWYIKRFAPNDMWSEGSMLYLATDLPRHVS